MANPLLSAAKMLLISEGRNTKPFGDGSMDHNIDHPGFIPSLDYRIKQEKQRREQEILDNQKGYEFFL